MYGKNAVLGQLDYTHT